MEKTARDGRLTPLTSIFQLFRYGVLF